MTKKKKISSAKLTIRQRIVRGVGVWQVKLRKRRADYLKRRPHRSFRRTRRRDYKRSLKLPGYWLLTKQVMMPLLRHKRVFFGLALLYVIFTMALSNMMAQETYVQFREITTGAVEEGLASTVVANLVLFWSVLSRQFSGAASSELGSPEQIFGVLFGIYTWLTVVVLLRAILAGKRLRLRDGLYSSGGPVIALIVLLLILAVQSVPAAVAAIAYSAANGSGLLDQTATLMLFGGGAILLAMLSLYWATSTILAMVIATLPGMYPMQAIKIAGDLVIGRRIRVLLRLLWSIVLLLLMWVVVLLPMILLDGALKSAIPGLDWLPLVPVTALLLMAWSVVFEAAYVYVLYRKVVDDDAAPA